jgi:hypothetical protein
MAREAAEQAFKAAARRTQQGLQQALKTAPMGKRRSLKTTAKAVSNKRAAA